MIAEMWTGLKIGIPTGVAMFAATNIETGNISIPVAVTVCVFVAGCTWWFGSRFQKIDDKLNYLHKRIDGLPCDKCEWPNGKKDHGR